MANTTIEWTESTWNPSTGCTKISPGCKNCYAHELAFRLQKMKNPKYVNAFDYTEHQKDLEIPLHWKKPRKIFVNSMSDLFHEQATDEFITKIFETMLKADWHTFQILTKRPEIMKKFVLNLLKLKGLTKLPNHIWLGVSIENQDYVNRLELLKEIPCIRFISFEPLLGSITEANLIGIHWVIIGGESGPNFRPVKKEWILSVKQLCDRDLVPFFFKQWGGFTPKSGGCELDHKIYHAYPKISNEKITLELFQ